MKPKKIALTTLVGVLLVGLVVGVLVWPTPKNALAVTRVNLDIDWALGVDDASITSVVCTYLDGGNNPVDLANLVYIGTFNGHSTYRVTYTPNSQTVSISVLISNNGGHVFVFNPVTRTFNWSGDTNATTVETN